jgi:hypothetical protein
MPTLHIYIRITSAESYRAMVGSMSAVAEQRRMLPDFKTISNRRNETESCRAQICYFLTIVSLTLSLSPVS